jgi:hypothetical protein
MELPRLSVLCLNVRQPRDVLIPWDATEAFHCHIHRKRWLEAPQSESTFHYCLFSRLEGKVTILGEWKLL